MADEEKKYTALRLSLIVVFGLIFVIGLLSRGAMTSDYPNKFNSNPDSKSMWKTKQIENIALANAKSIENRRVIMDKIRHNPHSAYLHNEMGIALAKDDLLSEAMTNFLKAINLDPKHAAAYHNLGIIHEYLEAYEESREYLKIARNLDPDNKIFSGTLKRVDFVLEYQPDSTRRYESQLNKALIAMGKQNTNLDQAQLILDDLIIENPDGIEALNALGVLYARTGDVDSAKDTFFKVISKNPGYILAYINLSTLFESINDYPQAFEYLERAKNLTDDRNLSRKLEHRMRDMSSRMLDSNYEK